MGTIQISAMQKQNVSRRPKLKWILLCTILFANLISFGQKTGGNITEAVSNENLTGIISTKKVLDGDGNIKFSIRNYSEEMLPPFIANEIHKKFQGKKVWGVTEISSETGIQYKVFLQDDKKWYHVTANSNGEVYLDNWYYKG